MLLHTGCIHIHTQLNNASNFEKITGPLAQLGGAFD
jgi:hypothetical protein